MSNRSKGIKVVSIITLLVSSVFPGQHARAEVVTAAESEGVKLTIYNQNFAVVRDLREVEFKSGINYLRFEDVAAKIDPTSVSFASLTAPNAVTVLEQNYQYDLLDPSTILSKSIGKTLKFKQFLPSGQTNELCGILLNQPETSVSDVNGYSSMTYHGLVLKTTDGFVLNPAGQVQLSELPPGLIAKPSLLWRLDCNKAGKHKSEISYQTSGMNWHCDYVVVTNSDTTKIDLTSWVTLENNCGATFRNAALKLMAGDVHRVVPTHYDESNMTGGLGGGFPKPFQEESFAEYHLYSLNGKTDVNDKETKQLTLFNANEVPVKKTFVFEPNSSRPWDVQKGNPAKVNVKLELENSEANRLGMPMPKGKIRVYQKDKDGALEFIGEDQIDHTPKDEKLRICLGDAFDIVAEQKQVRTQQVSHNVRKEAYSVSLRNHKDSAVTITVVEHAFGDWKILSSNQPYKKKDSTTFEYSVNMPANTDSEITYELETKV